jgi:RNA polymerase sigma-70 factor (ECF subfamily)
MQPGNTELMADDASGQADGARELEAARLPDHLDRLFRAALALSGSRYDAEDLVQETCARVLRRPRVLRNEDDGAYLMRALRNIWISWRTSARASRSVPFAPEDLERVADWPVAPQEAAVAAREAFAAVAELSPPLRETIVAVDVMGLSYKEASRALRVRQGTIMSRLHRAREAVATAIEGTSA